MGKRKDDGKGRLHVNMPAPLMEKLCVMARMPPATGSSSALAQVAMDAFAGVSRSLDTDGFAACERRRKKGEALVPVMLYVDAATVETAKSEAARLGVTVSTWCSTAVAAMLSEVNPMIYDAMRRDFAKTVRKWKQGFGANAKASRLCSGEPTVG